MKSEVLAQWVSAGATIFAAIAALVIPFIMQWLERQRADAEEHTAVKEVCVTISQIVRMYKELRDACAPGTPMHSFSRYSQISVESVAAGDALRRMLSQPGWTDGLHIAGSAAIVLADGVGKAGANAGKQQLDSAMDILNALHHVAQLANSRCERVRTYFKIERSQTDPVIVV